MELWRDLEELEKDDEFRDKLAREFPAGASIWAELEDPVSRRGFLQLMGASMALAGLGACTKMPAEKIIPYVTPPLSMTPGIAQHYASSFSFGGYAQGVLVESHDGRPTQVQGNPLHPASLGGSGLFMQASILTLYDPQRSKTVQSPQGMSTWAQFESELSKHTADWRARQGEGLRFLTGTVTSPTLASKIGELLRAFPKARWHAYEAVNLDRQKEAARLVFGSDLLPVYHLERARVILSLDSDFLGPSPAQLAYARAFASKRLPAAGRNRLYVAESSVSVTGATADHRLPLRPSQLRAAAEALAHELGISGLAAPVSLTEAQLTWLRAAAEDLRGGEALVIAGPQTEVATQAVVHAINQRLGNVGRTIDLIRPPEESASRQEASLAALVREMNQGQVSTLFISGANPAYSAPRGLGFAQALTKVPLRIHHALFEDETSALCQWHLPETHFLEFWGDARAFDGTVSFQQPLIAPLYEGRSLAEVLSLWLGESAASSRSLLEAHWRAQPSFAQARGFVRSFEQAIHDGLISGSASKPERVSLRPDWSARIPAASAPGPTGTLEVSLLPDSTVWDGSLAGNAWLQELPKPLLQLAWSNAALLSPATAVKLDVKDGDVVELQLAERAIEAPVLRMPGHPDGALTLSLGYGRTRAGKAASHRGFDAYELLDNTLPAFLTGVRVRRTGRHRELALVHAHHSMEGRDLVRHGTLASFEHNSHAIVPSSTREQPPTLLPDLLSASPEAWAMVIDLSLCIGCKACVIACQSENNIPVVGEEQVRRGREMHWIRVDRYFGGTPSNPAIFFQPVPCMHCETAPCEYVCPTAATNHSSDGLNQMIYNRCVGTRYCSNNCPYKVRRFNFFQYADMSTPTYRMMHNPDVTVRSRGVMEKCSYCVQRIQEGRIEAEKQDRPIRDGEIRTACEQACPTNAIVFGNKNDPKSRVARLRSSPLNYSMLGELGTRPRTTYLARVAHPNPALEAAPRHVTHGNA